MKYQTKIIRTIQYIRNPIQEAKIDYNCIFFGYLHNYILATAYNRALSLSKQYYKQNETHRLFNLVYQSLVSYTNKRHTYILQLFHSCCTNFIKGRVVLNLFCTCQNITNTNLFGAATLITKENTKPWNITIYSYYILHSILYTLYNLYNTLCILCSPGITPNNFTWYRFFKSRLSFFLHWMRKSNGT